MTIKNVCFIPVFLFYVLEVIENKNADRYLVRTILTVLDVLQFFVHQLLFVDFDGQVKHNQNAAAEFEQKKHAEAAE